MTGSSHGWEDRLDTLGTSREAAAAVPFEANVETVARALFGRVRGGWPGAQEAAVAAIAAMPLNACTGCAHCDGVRARAALASPAPAPLCMCGEPESDSVHHRPQVSDEEHAYEPAPTAAEYYGGVRYAQCDDTCTVDCGACKGNGPPAVVAPAPQRVEVTFCSWCDRYAAGDADRYLDGGPRVPSCGASHHGSAFLPAPQFCDYCGGNHEQSGCSQYAADAEANTDELRED